MKKFLSILILVAMTFLFFTGAAAEEKKFLAIENISPLSFARSGDSFYIFGAGKKILKIDSSGAAEIITSDLDMDNSYPLSMQGRLLALQRDSCMLVPLLQSEPGSEAIPLPITQKLAGGGENWAIMNIKADEQNIYFMLGLNEKDPDLLCSYSISKGTFQSLQIKDLRGYAPISDSEVYAFSTAPSGVNAHRLQWDGGAKKLAYTLPPQARAFAYDPGEDKLYYTAGSSFFYAHAGNAKAGSEPSPFAGEAVDAMLSDGKLAVLTQSGIAFPSFSGEAKERRVLRVLHAGSPSRDTQFLIEHPEVSIEYVQTDKIYETMDLSTALITDSIQYDVASFHSMTSAFEKIRQKGYLDDLSAYPELVEQVNKMYSPLKDFCWYDGKLQLIPYIIQPKANYYAGSPAMEEMKLPFESLPKTMEDMLDFIIAWYSKHGTPQDDEPNLFFTEAPREAFIMAVLLSYEAHYRHKNEPVQFDTDLLRRLLEKAEKAAALCPAYDGSQNWSSMLIYNMNISSKLRHFLPLPIDPAEIPLYDSELVGLSIHPKSEVKDIAAQYILHRLRHVEADQKVLLFQGKHEPVENPHFQESKLNHESRMELLDAAIAREENEVAKRQLIEQKNVEQAKFEKKEQNKYLLDQEDIDFYQQQIIPKMGFPYITLTDDNSIQNQETKKLVMAYIGGAISQDEFIKTLDRRYWFMTKEGQ